MFSVVNEIRNNSPSAMIGVVGTSIGSAAAIYVLVGVTGYITFGNSVASNIVSQCTSSHATRPLPPDYALTLPDPTNVASTIGKAAIVILVMFSIPLQVHPCRASLDAVLKWRPNRSQSTGGRQPGSPMLLPSGSSRPDHSNAIPMSDTRFAILTTVILTLAYLTALSVTSLDRVLAFVGSTGSTSISFILPGLFYYKISDPESIHHQRLLKEDDDIDESENSDAEDSGALAQSTGSIRSAASNTSPANTWRWRRKWRWDLEHLEHGLVRKMALALATYGVVVMVVCLVMNIFFVASH